MNSKLNLPIIILPMRVICSISSQESELSQFRMRLWNFDVIPTSTTYLEVLEMSTVCSIMVEKFKFPAVGYLPWPICRFKNSKQKLHTKSKKSAKLLLHLLPRWFGFPPLIIITVDLYLFLGLRRLAAEEGTFSKKTWLQKIKSGSWWAPCGPDFRVMDRRDPGTNGCLGIQWFGIWNV